MKCPYCGTDEDRVLDSRISKDGEEIRRRRECLLCKRRFTTREMIEFSYPAVVKKGGTRVPFLTDKVRAGIKKACEKRPIGTSQIDDMTKKVEQAVLEYGENEVPSTFIGERIIEQLKDVDHVAYVRFASVYREFKDVSEFMDELKKLIVKDRKR